jgi:predicted GNAT family N-acyltransferase
MQKKVPITDIENLLSFSRVMDVPHTYTAQFDCSYAEYNEFLTDYALDYDNKNISKTHILLNTKTREIYAYMSLITDAIKLTEQEKEQHLLNTLPFKTMPALKIGKLAVDVQARNIYSGIGVYMIKTAEYFVKIINMRGVACRFLTVDADVDTNKTVDVFYEKCGFKKNAEFKNRTFAISMRKDIYS